MSEPIVMEELERTEIQWVDDGMGCVGLSIIQTNRDTEGPDRIWIPASHAKAFIAALQSAAFAKR